MSGVEKCRTSALGGHVEEHGSCGALRISYNSCRNRHCTKGQHSKMVEWINARQGELLPIKYFHVVGTLTMESGSQRVPLLRKSNGGSLPL